VKYELKFYIPEDDILHSRRRENFKSLTTFGFISRSWLVFQSLSNYFVSRIFTTPLNTVRHATDKSRTVMMWIDTNRILQYKQDQLSKFVLFCSALYKIIWHVTSRILPVFFLFLSLFPSFGLTSPWIPHLDKGAIGNQSLVLKARSWDERVMYSLFQIHLAGLLHTWNSYSFNSYSTLTQLPPRWTSDYILTLFNDAFSATWTSSVV
jgi:hypothetical protein